MTRDSLPDFDISSADEFETALTAVVEEAVEADVDVRGAWEFKTRGSTHYWELNICELAREPDQASE